MEFFPCRKAQCLPIIEPGNEPTPHGGGKASIRRSSPTISQQKGSVSHGIRTPFPAHRCTADPDSQPAGGPARRGGPASPAGPVPFRRPPPAGGGRQG